MRVRTRAHAHQNRWRVHSTTKSTLNSRAISRKDSLVLQAAQMGQQLEGMALCEARSAKRHDFMEGCQDDELGVT